MAENNEEIKTNDELTSEETLIAEYKKLQENSVSLEKYQKDMNALKEKNKLYLQAITEGKKVNDDEPEKESNISEMVGDLSKFKGTNLEYWQKMTTAIDKVLETMPEEEIMKITGTEGLEEIVKVNESMKKMVKDSNGNSSYFRTLYDARVRDSAPRISAKINESGSLVNYLTKNQK